MPKLSWDFRILRATAALVIAATSNVPAMADMYAFQNVTLSDGGTLTGFFSYNPANILASDAYSPSYVPDENYVSSFNLDVSGGNIALFPDRTYSSSVDLVGAASTPGIPAHDGYPAVPGVYLFTFESPFLREDGREINLYITNKNAVETNQATTISTVMYSGDYSGEEYPFGSSPERTIVSGSIIPTSAENLSGGSESSPANVSINGPVSVINSTIPSGQSEQFYEFHWNGGYFSSEVSVAFPQNYPSNESSYSIQLYKPGYGSLPVLTDDNTEPASALTKANNFTEGVSVAGSPSTGYYDYCNTSYPPAGGCGLAAGNYEIGIVGDTSIDPTLTLSFDSPVFAPVAGVPEPVTWAMMLAGFGLMGAVLRRKKIAPSLSYT